MSFPDGLVLLDTNILVHLARGRAAGRELDARYHLVARPERPLISVVTIGEALSLAKQFKWGSRKTDALRALLHQLVVVDINHPEVFDQYATLDVTSRSEGQPMSKNDLWIAACTAAAGAWLLTADRDFESLRDRSLKVEVVDADSLPSGP